MTLVTLYFFAHQPFRLRANHDRDSRATVAPEQLESYYFDDTLNEEVFRKVAGKCYLPATTMLRDALKAKSASDKPFKVSFGLSGTFLEQAGRWMPEILDLFKEIVDTGKAELCGETYYHSLSGLFDDAKVDFRKQIGMHRK